MDFAKLTRLDPGGSPSGEEELVTAIVRVKRAGYRPANVKVRANLDEHLFTAELQRAQVEILQRDDGVQSVSLAQPLPLQKPPG